jgi:hypothetical protein
MKDVLSSLIPNPQKNQPSSISKSLIAAYNSTRYRIITDTPFNLKIGQRSRQLAKLYQKYNCLSAAVITAWNPQSMATSKNYNLAAQLRLEIQLSARSVPFITAIGEDPEMEWSGEESFLAFNLSLDATKDLGLEFLQNAVVWSGQDAIPQLVLLR